jgi:hypothetical protein
MILTAERPAANLYHVEVSGWDDNKAFFVENAELEWTEESGKQVTLNRGLNDGAVVFLRLLQNIGSDRSHPVAYQAECVARNSQGQRQFRLKPYPYQDGPQGTVPTEAPTLATRVPKWNRGPKWRCRRGRRRLGERGIQEAHNVLALLKTTT